MALTTTFDGTEVNLAESATDWFEDGATAAPESWSEIKIQGNASNATQASNKAGCIGFDGATAFDFSPAGTHEGQHVFIWVNCTTPGALDTIANSGLAIRLYSGNSKNNYAMWTVAGNDNLTILNNGKGGWVLLVLDPTKTPTDTNGTWDNSSVDQFGIWIDTIASARADNMFVDAIKVGWGLKITGTTDSGGNYPDEAWAQVAEDDMETVANIFGILQPTAGSEYLGFGRIKIGDDSGTLATTFSDLGKAIKFVSQQYYTGSAWANMVADGFLGIEIVDNATGSTQFTDGIVVGTDNGRSGSKFEGSDLHTSYFDASSLTNASSFVKLYNTTIKKMKNKVSLHNDADSLFYGGSVLQSAQFDPVGGPEIRNCIFAETSDADAAVLWNANIDMEDCSFIANTLGAAIEHPAQGTFNYTGLSFSGNTDDILYSAAASSGVLTINATDSNPSSYEIENATGNSVTISNPKNFKFTLNPSITGYEWRIYSVTALGSLTGATELDGEESASADNQTYAYNYGGDVNIAVQVMHETYVHSTTYYTLTATSQDVAILLTVDEND